MVERIYGKDYIYRGGTPSYLDGRYIYKLLNNIYGNFNVDKIEEITIEANPGTLDKEKLNIYKKPESIG